MMVDMLAEKRDARNIKVLRTLIYDLSEYLTDEGADFSQSGLDNLRRRVANALPKGECPEWLDEFRDPTVVQS